MFIRAKAVLFMLFEKMVVYEDCPLEGPPSGRLILCILLKKGELSGCFGEDPGDKFCYAMFFNLAEESGPVDVR